MRCIPRLSLVALLLAPLPAQTIDALVETLGKAESLDDEAIGIAGTKSETFKTYELLRDRATREELLKLLEHDGAIVRGYAFRALADRQEAVDWLALLKARARDMAKVPTFRGCTRSEQLLGDVVVEWARHRKLLTDVQWLDFGEVLVAGSSPLYAREWALRNLRFRDGMLHRIRTLAQGGDGPAHVALARYGVGEDLPLLVTWLSRDGVFDDTTAFLAAQAHADPSLLPVLVGLEAKARRKIAEGLVPRLREWLAAIAAQRSPAAARFLTRFLAATPSDGRHRQVVQVYEAVLARFGGAEVFANVREELQRHASR
jgi:hypothetical protein